MKSQREFLQRLVEKLKSSDIEYMISGSICSGFHGQPRATNDVDIVIKPSKQQLLCFIASLGPDYYVSEDAALQALENNLMFNVIDIEAGWKADLIIRKKRTYSQEEFSRKSPKNLMGMELDIATPEDSVLSKLEWTKGRASQMQLNDVLGILVVQWNNLDFNYLREWADKLEVGDALEQLVNEARKLRETD